MVVFECLDEMDENGYIETVKKDGLLLRMVNYLDSYHGNSLCDRQTYKICMAAVMQNGMALEFADYRDDKIYLAAVQQNGLALQFVGKYFGYTCMRNRVEFNYNDLLNSHYNVFVSEQNHEIRMAAVKQTGLALQFVGKYICFDKEPNEPHEVMYNHIGNYGKVEFVSEQNDEICMAAVQQNPRALEYVKEQTPEICEAAMQQNRLAFRYIRKS